MAADFALTLRSLNQEAPRLRWLLATVALLIGWGLWLFGAQIDVYASSSEARLEVSRRVHRVAAETEGRIVELHVELGESVERGEVLVRLDPRVEQAELDKVLVSIAALRGRVQAVEGQLQAERTKGRSRQRLDELAAERAGWGLEQAVASAAQNEQETEIARVLRVERINSKLESVRAEGELARSRLMVNEAATEVERLEAAQRYEQSAQLAREAELGRQLAELRAEDELLSADADTVRQRLSRLEVRAPASGRLGNVAAVQVGDVIRSGEELATVVPADGVRVVAQFDPTQAAGKIMPGQPARVRLSGFAWAEYGSLLARVAQVASEPRLGTLRVELDVQEQASHLPVQHGLPGVVDVEIERASPWVLVSRNLGHALAGPSEAHPSELARSEP